MSNAQPLQSEILDRTPPHDADAEKSLLASIMLKPELIADVVAMLPVVSCFYVEGHKAMYSAMLRLRREGKPVDTTLLVSVLRERGELELLGGVHGVATFYDSYPTAAHWKLYSEKLVERWKRRRARQVGEQLIHGAHNGQAVDVLVNDAISDLSQDCAEAAAKPPSIDFGLMTLADLDAVTAEIEYLIEGTLAARQPCILAGGKKSLKTTIMVAMFLALATAQLFLGRLRVDRRVRCVMFSAESGVTVLRETFRRIALAMGFPDIRLIEGLSVSSKLPKFGDLPSMDALRAVIRSNRFEVVGIDPCYMALPSGDNGNLFVMGELLQSISQVCDEEGATLILAHHTKRGTVDPFAPPELEDIAWAGFAEYARQWILVGRRELYTPGSGDHRLWLNSGGSAGHSSLWALDICEGSGHANRQWSVDMMPAAEARQDAAERQQQAKHERQASKAASAVESAKKRIVNAMAKIKAGETARAIRDAAGVSGNIANLAFAGLFDDGAIVACEIRKQNRVFDGYKLAENTQL